MTTQERELSRVVAADDMSRNDFCRHMTLRHGEKLGSLDGIDPDPLFTSDYVESCWRAYHKQIHELKLQPDVGHYHDPQKGRPR